MSKKKRSGMPRSHGSHFRTPGSLDDKLYWSYLDSIATDKTIPPRDKDLVMAHALAAGYRDNRNIILISLPGPLNKVNMISVGTMDEQVLCCYTSHEDALNSHMLAANPEADIIAMPVRDLIRYIARNPVLGIMFNGKTSKSVICTQVAISE